VKSSRPSILVRRYRRSYAPQSLSRGRRQSSSAPQFSSLGEWLQSMLTEHTSSFFHDAWPTAGNPSVLPDVAALRSSPHASCKGVAMLMPCVEETVA